MIKLYVGVDCETCGMEHWMFDCPHCGAEYQDHWQTPRPFMERCMECGVTILVGQDSIDDFSAREKANAPDLYYWSKPEETVRVAIISETRTLDDARYLRKDCQARMLFGVEMPQFELELAIRWEIG